MLTQLNPPLPLYCIGGGIFPEGKCVAHAVVDYSPEHDLQWVCFFDIGGKCFNIPNPLIRGQINATMGRIAQPDISPPNDYCPCRKTEPAVEEKKVFKCGDCGTSQASLCRINNEDLIYIVCESCLQHRATSGNNGDIYPQFCHHCGNAFEIFERFYKIQDNLLQKCLCKKCMEKLNVKNWQENFEGTQKHCTEKGTGFVFGPEVTLDKDEVSK
jgi:hypothetical protein